MRVDPGNFTLVLGGNTFQNVKNLITCGGQPLFTVTRRESDGELGIDFDVYDSQQKKVAVIRNSRVVTGDKDTYEIVHAPDMHAVIEKATRRAVALIVRRKLGNELDVSLDSYLPNGVRLMATPVGMFVGGLSMSGNHFVNCGTGIAL